ncbi:MAG: hypothetical protein KatS3mg125_0461 [Lysobacterales bacterium]|jgi:hypothetical protein|nr:MAG: hypothetical protein KatS3mg125_0461 [Xanthomonadales bacterium]
MSAILAVVLLLSGPSAEVDLALDRYQESLAAARAAPPTQLEERATELLRLASAIAPAFIEAQPACRAYLEAALTVKERWPLLGPESIERDFHQDGALPKGAPALCYHMKDLIVHPATVLVLLAHGVQDVTVLRRELDEILAHVQAVRALIEGDRN